MTTQLGQENPEQRGRRTRAFEAPGTAMKTQVSSLLAMLCLSLAKERFIGGESPATGAMWKGLIKIRS